MIQLRNSRTDLLVEGDISVSAVFEIIDPDAPVKITFLINNGDNYTNDRNVVLTIEAEDEQNVVTEMIICNYEDFSGCDWEEYTTVKNWELTSGDGVKDVYIKFKDAVENESLPSSDSIILDTELTFSFDYVSSDIIKLENNVLITYNRRPVFFGKGEVGVKVNILIESDPISGETVIDSNGNWSWAPGIDIYPGKHNVTITAQDEAGNTFQETYILNVLLHEELTRAGDNIYPITGLIILIFSLINFVLVKKWGWRFLHIRIKSLQ